MIPRTEAEKRLRPCAAVWFAVLLPLALQTAQARPEIEHWTNNAGVPVYFVHVSELPMVDIQLRFTRSGSAHEGDKHGLASMTARMLHNGAGGMDADEIAETFSNLGARSGASAGTDSSHVSLRSLTDPKYLDKALTAWLKVFSSPDFPQKQFERQRKNVLTGIESHRQNPGTIASHAFNEAIYRDHPYAHPTAGSEETVKALTLDDLKGFHKKHYATANLIITMVGAISREQAAAISDRVSTSLETGEATAPLPPVPPLKKAVTIHIPFPSEQAHVKIGQPFIHRSDPDFYALRLGNDVLGSTGFGSRLLEEIRVKRGLAYSVGSRFGTPASTGAFQVSFQTHVPQVDEAIKAAREVLRKFVASGPTEEEVAQALDRLRGGEVFRTSSNGAILGAVSNIAFHKQGLDHLYNYISKFEKENRESITAAYRMHLDPDKMVTVIVGGPAR